MYPIRAPQSPALEDALGLRVPYMDSASGWGADRRPFPALCDIRDQLRPPI